MLFTNGDELEYNDATIAGCLNPGVMLRELVEQCDGRHNIKNRDRDRTQVTELLRQIRRMTQENNFELYTKKRFHMRNLKDMCSWLE